MITLEHLVEIFDTGSDYSTKQYTYRRFAGSIGYCVKRLKNSYFNTTNELCEWKTVAVKDEYGIIHVEVAS